jgi:hypothetical protein
MTSNIYKSHTSISKGISAAGFKAAPILLLAVLAPQSEIAGFATLYIFWLIISTLGCLTVDVGLGCESGYDEVSYGLPLYGRHIIELEFLGEQLQRSCTM